MQVTLKDTAQRTNRHNPRINADAPMVGVFALCKGRFLRNLLKCIASSAPVIQQDAFYLTPFFHKLQQEMPR
ncbi:MAG: hypothetical protein D6694_12120 [Gammaproteobacteria bacterium]|nr:MAG: hypothetical protein D6694_12120 [Gammaproteobacteria bacterium]